MLVNSRYLLQWFLLRGIMRVLVCIGIVGLGFSLSVSAQSAWGEGLDYHLTNGTHFSSYGVETAERDYPYKNLYVDPVATLVAGSTEIDDIYHLNQVYLDGGTIYASKIDADNFTWNGGSLYLDGGVHSSTYGIEQRYSEARKYLYIKSGAKVNGGGAVSRYSEPTHGNSVVVSGAGSEWNTSGGLTIGGDSRGNSLGISNGGMVTSSGSTVGSGWRGQYNTVNVSGSGSKWNSGGLSVGVYRGGHNRLSIEDGSVVNSSWGEIGGERASDDNVVTVSGNGSLWNISSNLRVGDSSLRNHLMVSDGAVVSNSNSSIGISGSYTSEDNSVDVAGAGARWVMSGDLTVGDSSAMSSGNGVVVSGGAYVECNTAIISKHNSVDVSGLGTLLHSKSRLDVEGDLRIGELAKVVVGNVDPTLVPDGSFIVDGKGGVDIALSGSSILNAGASTLGYLSDHRSWVQVAGVGSLWSSEGELVVGEYGNGNQLDILYGGAVASAAGHVGRHSSNNWVVVAGPGAEWINKGELGVGASGSENKLRIYGGMVSNATGRVGQHAVANDNSVWVAGDGSTWNNAETLVIGHEENSGNSVVVSYGGEVIAQNGLEIKGVGNELSLDGGRLTVGVNFDASIDGFHYESGSTLAVQGQVSGLPVLEAGRRLETPHVLGDFEVQGVFAPGMSPADSVVDGSFFVAENGALEMELGGYVLGAEYDRLTVTGNSVLAGRLDLVFLDAFVPTNGASFDLFNWGGGLEEGSSFSAITPLMGDLEWDASELYTTGRLSVIPEPSVIVVIGFCGISAWFIRSRFLM